MLYNKIELSYDISGLRPSPLNYISINVKPSSIIKNYQSLGPMWEILESLSSENKSVSLKYLKGKFNLQFWTS